MSSVRSSSPLASISGTATPRWCQRPVKGTLGVILVNTSPCHQRPGRSTQIVRSPFGKGVSFRVRFPQLSKHLRVESLLLRGREAVRPRNRRRREFVRRVLQGEMRGQQLRIHRLVITDNETRVLGVVSAMDLVGAIAAGPDEAL